MRLTDLEAKSLISSGSQIVRNAEIESLGYVTHRTNTKPFLAYAGNQKFLDAAIKNPLVSALLVKPELVDVVPSGVGIILSEKPEEAFFKIHRNLIEKTDFYWSNFDTKIDPLANVSSAAYIADKNVIIGPGSVVEPGAVVHEKTVIGSGCVVRSNTVLGSQGFEFKWIDGNLSFVEHGHGVKIQNGAIIHASCAVDKGLFGEPTVVGARSCLDNMVHVAHGVKIGEDCIVAAGVIFAAAVIVGNRARIDPNATIGHEVHIGCGAYVTMGSAVVSDVEANQRVTGNFAISHRGFIRNHMNAKRRK